MKLRIFNSWLQKLLIRSAEINLCSWNSGLISPTELREGLAWVYFTVVKYLTLLSGSLPKVVVEHFCPTMVRINVLEKVQR